MAMNSEQKLKFAAVVKYWQLAKKFVRAYLFNLITRRKLSLKYSFQNGRS